MNHYVYILKSKKDNNFYVGYTKDLNLRFKQHKEGKVNSTRNRMPIILIYYECCLSQRDATKREKYLKTYLGRYYIKKRLKSYLTG